MTAALGAVVLMLSIGTLCARRFGAALAAGVMQAWAAAAALGEVALPAALVAVALNGIALPLAMRRQASTAMTVNCNPLLGWTAVVTLLLANVVVLTEIGPGEGGTLGASVVLLGLLFVALRLHPLAPALGLLSAQNGLVLVASASPHLHPTMALIIATPWVPAMILAEAWLRR